MMDDDRQGRAISEHVVPERVMKIGFAGKTVVVSGAGIGFGRAIAENFAALGANVHGCDILEAGLAETAKSGVTTARVDLTDRQAATGWIRSVEAHAGGAVDILINNAGGVAGQAPKPLEDVADADWDKIVAVNLGAAFALSRAAAPAMKAAKRGRIVNISSGAGLQASLTGIQAYCSAKHAVIGLTRQLAHELGPFGITVNSVAPGFIRTNPATEKQWEGYGSDGQQALVERIALKHLGTAQDIVNAVIFFASDLASFVNGQVLSVDGGR
ncbi:3-oxoacyl-[acyl-carrier protein] reductase [Rhizobiales bacterium GAS191]|nr:3-oxoacyl-[acyl-carrier protein] reductase [Rhizobiales bacterium GAS191]